MLLVNHNLSFIDRAQADTSWVGKTKYELGGRITSLGTALFLVAETIGYVALAAFASVAYLMSFGLWEKASDWSVQSRDHALSAGSMSLNCFLAVLSPKLLQSRLISGPLSAEVRENRLRIGAGLIQGKLEKELRAAQNQMLQETDGDFEYLEGTLGSVEQEQVGGYNIGVCHHIGRRPTMEDQHLATAFDLHLNGKIYPISLFGVFDGHGGPEASAFLKARLKDKLETTLIELNQHGLTDQGIWNALKLTFVRLDQEFRAESGSTATVAMILDGKLWTANVGDSRTILDNGGEILQLTEDAKPADAKYKKGIENRGGRVRWNGGMRVNGILGVARAVGDHALNGAISARPKIIAVPLANIKPNSHLVLTCDGIYDVASSRQVGKAVRDHRQETPARLAKNIVFSAFQARSSDNLSAMVVKLS